MICVSKVVFELNWESGSCPGLPGINLLPGEELLGDGSS